MSLQPARQNFRIWKGATFEERIIYYTDAGQTRRDLTGYSADLTIRDEPNGTPLLVLNTTNGGITLGGVNGSIDLLISGTATALIDWTAGVYDLILTAPTGKTYALLWGAFGVRGI
jgi:hypothetical protein